MEDKKLKYEMWDGEEIQVSLYIDSYMDNNNIYVALVSDEHGQQELFADITVNLSGLTEYCGYIDTNNSPQLEKFVEENEIGEIVGVGRPSGFCTYPLCIFNPEKLRELCPEGMKQYEQSIGVIEPEKRR